jgi:hypothetical protein
MKYMYIIFLIVCTENDDGQNPKKVPPAKPRIFVTTLADITKCEVIFIILFPIDSIEIHEVYKKVYVVRKCTALKIVYDI